MSSVRSSSDSMVVTYLLLNKSLTEKSESATESSLSYKSDISEILSLSMSADILEGPGIGSSDKAMCCFSEVLSFSGSLAMHFWLKRKNNNIHKANSPHYAKRLICSFAFVTLYYHYKQNTLMYTQ